MLGILLVYGNVESFCDDQGNIISGFYRKNANKQFFVFESETLGYKFLQEEWDKSTF